MRPLPAQRIGLSHGLLRALADRGRLRLEEFVTEFSEEDLFPPELPNEAGRTRQLIAYARAAGLVVEDRGAVELTDLGKRYIRAGDAGDVFSVSPGQAEWLRRQLHDKHLTDSIFHGAAIGLSLWSTLEPGQWVALTDFGRAAAHLGRAGWDNENTFRLQGERLTFLLEDMELIDEQRRLTPTGEETRQALRLPLHMRIGDLAANLNPGGGAGAAAAAEEERAALGLAAPAPTASAPVAEEPPAASEPPADEEEAEWMTAVRPAVPAPQASAPPAPPPAPSVPPSPNEPPPATPAAAPVETPVAPPAPEPIAAEPPPAAPAAPALETPVEAPAGMGPIEAAALAAAAGAPAPPAPQPPPTPPQPAPAPPAAQPAAAAPQQAPATPAAPQPPAAPSPPPAVSMRPTTAMAALRPEDLAAWKAHQQAAPAASEAPARDGAFLALDDVRAAGEERGLVIDDGVYAAAIAALASGRHVVLTGGAGSGKTQLALALAEAAVRSGRSTGTVVVAAGASLGARELLGRHVEGEFRPGIVPAAVQDDHWLVVDELDRARMDRALGRVSTLLGGEAMQLGGGGSLEPPAGWRMIATMGDLAQVGRTSAALRRRFVFVEIPVLDRAQLESLVERWAEGDEVAADVGRRLVAVSEVAELGPGLYRDAIAYVRARRRLAPADRTALTLEALAGFVLPQLEGGGEELAARAVKAAGLGG